MLIRLAIAVSSLRSPALQFRINAVAYTVMQRHSGVDVVNQWV